MSTVENGNTVSVHYRGTFDDGTQFDSSYDRGEPITFTVGSGQMISGFDSSMPGMTVGETKSISLAPENAYGPRVDEAVQTVPLTAFAEDAQFVVGATIQGQSPDGQPFMAKIESCDDTNVVLDFNHPMAGKTLNFDIELINIS
tara:strand:- start:313 stop:744 length:432 start_codon:yes stop_codon:yes gene_type:complete